jgi:hypothetical protein
MDEMDLVDEPDQRPGMSAGCASALRALALSFKAAKLWHKTMFSRRVFKTFLAFSVLFATTAVEARIPSSAWKSGILKRVTKEHLTGESGQLGKKPPKHGIYISYYFVESENHLYEGDDVKLKHNEKGFPVAVDGPVQFFVNGTDMFLRDQKGKQHRLRLVNVLPTDVHANASGTAEK